MKDEIYCSGFNIYQVNIHYNLSTSDDEGNVIVKLPTADAFKIGMSGLYDGTIIPQGVDNVQGLGNSNTGFVPTFKELLNSAGSSITISLCYQYLLLTENPAEEFTGLYRYGQD